MRNESDSHLGHLEQIGRFIFAIVGTPGLRQYFQVFDFLVQRVAVDAQEVGRAIATAIELAIDAGEVSLEDVFDRDYKLVEGSNPVQYEVRFNAAADKYVRPILDRTKKADGRIIGSAIGGRASSLVARSVPLGALRVFIIAFGLFVAAWQFLS